jgi:hypothetical protein
VDIEEQRARPEARGGLAKPLARFCLASQMESLDDETGTWRSWTDRLVAITDIQATRRAQFP